MNTRSTVKLSMPRFFYILKEEYLILKQQFSYRPISVYVLIAFFSLTYEQGYTQEISNDSLENLYSQGKKELLLQAVENKLEKEKDFSQLLFLYVMKIKGLYRTQKYHEAWEVIKHQSDTIDQRTPLDSFEVASYMETYQRAGDLAYILKHEQEGINALEKGIRIAERYDSKDYVNICRLYKALAANLRRIGRFDESQAALDYVYDHLDLMPSDKATTLKMACLSDNAQLYTDQNKHQQAIDLYHELMSIAKNQNNENRQRIYANNLAIAYVRQGNLALAEVSMRKALILYEEQFGKDSYRMINPLNNLNYVLINMNKSIEVQQNYGRIIKLMNANADECSKTYIDTYFGLSKAYTNQKKYSEARKILMKADSLYMTCDIEDDMHRFDLFIELGVLNDKLDNTSEALSYFDKALNIKSEHSIDQAANTAILYHGLAELYAKNNDEEAFLLNINKAYEHQNYSPTKPYEFQNISSGYQLLNVLNTHLYYNHQGFLESKNDSLLKEIRNSISVSDSLLNYMKYEFIEPDSRSFIVHSTESIYESIIEHYYDQYKITKNELYLDSLYRYVERSSNMFLYEHINENDVSSYGIPHALVEKKDSLLDSIKHFKNLLLIENTPDDASLQKKLDTYHNAYYKHLSLIKKEYPQYYNNIYQRKHIPLAEIQSKLTTDQLIIEYFLGESKLYILYISKQNTTIDVKDIDEKFTQNILDAVVALDNNSSKLDEHALYMSEKLLSSVLIKKFKELIIVPDDEIALLPFEFLKIDQTSLVNNHIISYKYSSNDISGSRRNNRNSKKIGFAPFAGGDELLRQDIFKKLSFTNDEMNLVSKTIGMEVYKDSIATETMVKNLAPSASILHLATHGITELQPEYSYLVFSNSTDTLNDGALFAYEIINMSLDLDLTVLSACNTGSGNISRGQGVNSLGKAFAYAGSRSELVNLWQVNDKANSLIISYFYEGLKKGEKKSVALRNAKLRFLSEVPEHLKSPYYWAGLVIYGSDDPLNNNPTYPIKWMALSLLAILGLFTYTFIRKRKN